MGLVQNGMYVCIYTCMYVYIQSHREQRKLKFIWTSSNLVCKVFQVNLHLMPSYSCRSNSSAPSTKYRHVHVSIVVWRDLQGSYRWGDGNEWSSTNWKGSCCRLASTYTTTCTMLAMAPALSGYLLQIHLPSVTLPEVQHCQQHTVPLWLVVRNRIFYLTWSLPSVS